jgi:hypothetical protein
MTPLKM